MAEFKNFFDQGLSNSLLMKNNGSLSHNGPWASIYEDTVVARLFLGDFCAADFTVVVDLNTTNKEIIKCTLVSTVNDASLVVHSRNGTSTDLAELSARVNDSYVELLINPATPKAQGAKFIYTSQLFQTQNPPQT